MKCRYSKTCKVPRSECIGPFWDGLICREYLARRLKGLHRKSVADYNKATKCESNYHRWMKAEGEMTLCNRLLREIGEE